MSVKVVARPREAYARTWRSFEGLELSIGLEYVENNNEHVDGLTVWLSDLADRGLRLHRDSVALVGFVERVLREAHPDRAYFIETEREGRGVQVFQPFGIPQEHGGQT